MEQPLAVELVERRQKLAPGQIAQHSEYCEIAGLIFLFHHGVVSSQIIEGNPERIAYRNTVYRISLAP